MTTDHKTEGWEHIGRAAEHFARRIARDARRFAARVEGHVGDLAHDVRHEWRRAGRPGACDGAPRSGDDVRRVFDEVRGVLASILDGVDELVTEVFQGKHEEEWTRVVCNRDATCAGCAQPIAAGSEAFVRADAETREFRCQACGLPGTGPASV